MYFVILLASLLTSQVTALLAAVTAKATANAHVHTVPHMYGLTRVANSAKCSGALSGCLQLVSIDLSTGKLTNIGHGHTPLAAVGDLRVVANEVYYVLADECGQPCNATGSVLLGISTKDGSELCRRKVPSLAEVGLVGGGQSFHHDTKHNRLILSGLNSTDGGQTFTHVVLSAPLNAHTCGPFTKLGEFQGDSAFEPMAHGSTFDVEGQRLFLTLSTGAHAYGMGVVDIDVLAHNKVNLTKTYAMTDRISLWGPTYMTTSHQLIGTESNPQGQGINWVALDLNINSGNWSSAPLKYAANINTTFPGLEGNLGSMRAYDSVSGLLYIMAGRGDPSNPTLEIVTIDVHTGTLVAHSGTLNGDVGYSGSVLSQISIGTSTPVPKSIVEQLQATSVAFSNPTSTGHSVESRRDPILLSFPSLDATLDNAAHVLCTGVDSATNKTTYVESNDGGSTWFPASESVADAAYGWLVGVGGGQTRSGSVNGMPSGYIKNQSWMTGPWKTTRRLKYSINSTDNAFTVTTEPTTLTSNASSSVWERTPHPVGLLAFDSGGATWLGGTTYLATVWVWYSPVPLKVNHGNPCCNGSVVAYISLDDGESWQYQSEIASKQSVNEQGFVSQEGPNENDVVLLKDGRTIFCVLRIDGGDGVPTHKHVPYVFATSIDLGKTWTMKAAPPFMLSARPRAIVLPNGALIVSGGRPALSMWVSKDGFGHSWEEYDLPTEHNNGIIDQKLPRYCSEFLNATYKDLGWMQSSCYTRLGVVSNDTGIVCYEMQGAGSGGEKTPPPECAFEGSEIFCMRFTVVI